MKLRRGIREKPQTSKIYNNNQLKVMSELLKPKTIKQVNKNRKKYLK